VASSANIVLVGFMGTGKSAVGERLAARLGFRFADTDALIVADAGRTIPEIFECEGESGFRDRETAILRSQSGAESTVLATGGGILGRDENIRLLRSMGPLVCLSARPAVILERTRPWQERPMLARSADPHRTVESLLSERAPCYAQADLTVDTSDRTIEEVVDEICRVLP
jgi:shikimate kinase